jgi:hypothetical protein
MREREASARFKAFVIVAGLLAIAVFWSLRADPSAVFKVFVVFSVVILVAALVEQHRGRSGPG